LVPHWTETRFNVIRLSPAMSPWLSKL